MRIKFKPLLHGHPEWMLQTRKLRPLLRRIGQAFVWLKDFQSNKVLAKAQQAGALVGLSLLLLPGQAIAVDFGVAEALRLQVRELRAGRQISGVDLAAGDLLGRIYEPLGFATVWSRPTQIQSLIDAVVASANDGLNPHDYHLSQIRDAHELLVNGETILPADRAALDLMLTDSIIRLAYHQRFGKTDSETFQPRWSFTEQLDGEDPVPAILRLIRSDSIATTLQNSLSRNDAYRRLQAALARYREIADSGGRPRVANGPTLHPGAIDDRLTALARRLSISGDLVVADADTGTATYDETLQLGVRRFQSRHGLEVDGLVGEHTLRALNISAETRVEQIRINLERARWILHAMEDESVLVNIASFEAFLVWDREIVWQAKVQVGEIDHQTPTFASVIERLVFNPKWTVPRSIATEEMLPEIKEDAAFLRAGDYEIYDGDGVLIDPDDVDWAAINIQNFNYTIVQRPGSRNALGRIKFEFPNEYAVYLHDTPNKALFDNAHRACSHGCIRLESPLDLAAMLLEGSGWQPGAINALIAAIEMKTVSLARPVPILIQYWTAEVDSDGATHFYDDIYERDRPIIDALNSRYPKIESAVP